MKGRRIFAPHGSQGLALLLGIFKSEAINQPTNRHCRPATHNQSIHSHAALAIRQHAGCRQDKVALAPQARGLPCPALAARPPQTWGQSLPGASFEDTNTRLLLHGQVLPVTARGTKMERKVLTSPFTCSSPSSLTSQLRWQKKACV